MAKHKKKIAAKPGRLDKYLPLVQTLRDKISLLKDPSSMQDEGFKEHVEQALASIVNFKSPQTWAPNLSLGDGFFNNLSSSAFLPSVIYIKAPGSRN